MPVIRTGVLDEMRALPLHVPIAGRGLEPPRRGAGPPALLALLWIILLFVAPGCDSNKLQPRALSSGLRLSDEPGADDARREACRTHLTEIAGADETASLAPLEPARRSALLGRARGGVTVFTRDLVRSEAETARRAEIEKHPPGYRIVKYLSQHKRDKTRLVEAFLVGGYLWADDPRDAFELEARVSPTDLFDAERLVIERGEQRFSLVLRGKDYVYEFGELAGERATIMLGDRVQPADAAPAPALTGDVVALQEREGFDRIAFTRFTARGHAATLTYGTLRVAAVIAQQGTRLSVACHDADSESLRTIATHRRRHAEVRRPFGEAMSAAITQLVTLAPPFDRPREVEGPDRDGELRPHWMGAYLRGSHSFKVDDHTYAVFHPDGRARPPHVCVDMVVEVFERASGAYYAPRGRKPERARGAIRFDELGAVNARGVIGLGAFMSDHPELFEFTRFEQRIPFSDRSAFFEHLLHGAGPFQPGDVLAIQGLKADGRVHQHAILLEQIDPITGFPHALADQMRLPRRRSWEAIMAEAPKRSLLYRARPLAPIVSRVVTTPRLAARADD